MRTCPASARGFTLIEVLVTLVIMGVFILLAMPSFSLWMVNTRIRTAAEATANGLQLARNEAVRRNASVQYVKGAGTDSSWTVSCVATSPGCPDTNAIQSRITGDAAITVTPDNGNTVVFDNFGMRTTPAPAVVTASFDVDATTVSAADSRDLRVTVDVGGNIRMCDPNTTAPDPRAC